jgi:hypothetical protein
MRKRRIRNFNPQRDKITNKSQRPISDERTGKQAGFAQDLEPVASAEHKLAGSRIADHRPHDGRETRDRTAPEIIAVGKTARQNNRVVLAKGRFFVPDKIGLQTFDAVDSGDTILVAIGTGELNDCEFHADLMGGCARALFLMIIVHHERSMDHSWDPAEKR